MKTKQLYYTIGQKIKELRLSKGWSLEELGERIGKTKKTVQRYENGEHKLTLELMKEITDALDFEWDIFERFVSDTFRTLIDEPLIAKQKSIYKSKNNTIVPVYGRICAGNGITAFEDKLDEIICPYPRIRGDMIALQVAGESMNKVIPHGVYSLIKVQEGCENGQICAIIINGEDALLKRVYRVDNETIMLKPESTIDDYRPMTFVGDEINQIKIVGKYIGYVSPLAE